MKILTYSFLLLFMPWDYYFTFLSFLGPIIYVDFLSLTRLNLAGEGRKELFQQKERIKARTHCRREDASE